VIRVLVLREAAAARQTADALQARGMAALIMPLETVVRLDPPPPPEAGAVTGFLITSAHAIAWLQRHYAGDGRRVFAVGPATARNARAAGFADVVAAAGSAQSLAALLMQEGPGDGPLLYAAGVDRRPDLELALAAAGRAVIVRECYDVVFRAPEPAERAAMTGATAPDCALLLSAGQARAFAALVPDGMAGPRPYCLSARIAQALPPRLLHNCVVSPVPALDGLLAMLENDRCSLETRRYMQ